jgi:hypothetical protein
MDKGAKDKLAGSPGENGGRIGKTKRYSLKKWKGQDKEEVPGKDEEKKWNEIFKCWE